MAAPVSMRGVKLEEEGAVAAQGGWPRGAGARGGAVAKVRGERLSLIHISEPTRRGI